MSLIQRILLSPNLFCPQGNQRCNQYQNTGNWATNQQQRIGDRKAKPGNQSTAQYKRSKDQQNGDNAVLLFLFGFQSISLSKILFRSRYHIGNAGVMWERSWLGGLLGQGSSFRLQIQPLILQLLRPCCGLFGLSLGRQTCAGGFLFSKQFLRLLLRRKGGFGAGCILQGGGIFQRRAVIFQSSDLCLQLLLLYLGGFCLFLQIVQIIQLRAEQIPLVFCLRQQAALIVAAFVFQILQGLCQLVAGTAFIAGGNQVIQPAPQGIVLGNRQIRQLQKA